MLGVYAERETDPVVRVRSSVDVPYSQIPVEIHLVDPQLTAGAYDSFRINAIIAAAVPFLLFLDSFYSLIN